MTVALLSAMLAMPPRAFLVDLEREVCETLAPLTAAWLPAPGGPDWRPPRAWRTAAAAATAAAAVLAAEGRSAANASGFAFLRAVNAGVDEAAALLVASADARDGHVLLETNLLFARAFAAAARERPGALSAAWWEGGDGGACRLPPELAELLQVGDASCRAGAGDGRRALREGLPFELLDWWASPSPALEARVLRLAAPLASLAAPWLLVGVHLRIGTAAPGAAYVDQPRDSVEAAPPLAARCAREAGARLLAATAAVAPRGAAPPRIAWFVASDNWQGEDASVGGEKKGGIS